MEVIDGFLNIDKSINCTSHDCIQKIRKVLNIKKVGHSGTLDPQVTGVLPIAIGSATRFIQYLPQEKIYIGIIQLGIKTTTDDIHGEIIREKNIPKLSFKELDYKLNNFRGTFKQIPPNVSSVHINGERAYKKSLRKENFILPAKEVTVNNLFLKNWDQKNGLLEIEISCSAGTYIRAIARDLGILLKSEGSLFNLRRIKASGFTADMSIELTNLIKDKKNINKIITPISKAISHLPKIILKSQEEILYWQTGRKISISSENIINNQIRLTDQKLLVFDEKSNLLGLGINISEETMYLQPKLVLNAK